MNPVGVQLGPEPLRDQVDVVILEVLGGPRDKRHADSGGQQKADAAKELAGGVLGELRRVAVDDVAKDQRVEQGKHLVDRRQHQRERDQASVIPQVRIEELHLAGNSTADAWTTLQPRLRACSASASAASPP